MKKNCKALTLIGLFSIFALVLSGNSPVMAEQRHMENALSALKEAKIQLEKASRNKGGHRAKAIEHIDQAINQVNRGIQYANTHNPNRAGGNHVNLNGLEGTKASMLHSKMESHGFKNKRDFKRNDVSYSIWWNRSSRQCVSVATNHGEVKIVEAVSRDNCH